MIRDDFQYDLLCHIHVKILSAKGCWVTNRRNLGRPHEIVLVYLRCLTFDDTRIIQWNINSENGDNYFNNKFDDGNILHDRAFKIEVNNGFDLVIGGNVLSVKDESCDNGVTLHDKHLKSETGPVIGVIKNEVPIVKHELPEAVVDTVDRQQEEAVFDTVDTVDMQQEEAVVDTVDTVDMQQEEVVVDTVDMQQEAVVGNVDMQQEEAVVDNVDMQQEEVVVKQCVVKLECLQLGSLQLFQNRMCYVKLYCLSASKLKMYHAKHCSVILRQLCDEDIKKYTGKSDSKKKSVLHKVSKSDTLSKKSIKTRNYIKQKQPVTLTYIFKCDKCNKWFATQNGQYKHYRSHSFGKYACSICSKWFQFPKNLTDTKLLTTQFYLLHVKSEVVGRSTLLPSH